MSNDFDRAQEAYDNMQSGDYYLDTAQKDVKCPECDHEFTADVEYDIRYTDTGYTDCEECEHSFEVDL